MNPQELRLNNLVKPNPEHYAAFGEQNTGIVTLIQEDRFTVSNHYPGKWFEGIKLTEEWVLKLGFEKKPVPGSNGLFDYLKNFLLEYSFEQSCFWLSPCYQDDREVLIQTKPIKYVHELQNLFFAITGEELILLK